MLPFKKKKKKKKEKRRRAKSGSRQASWEAAGMTQVKALARWGRNDGRSEQSLNSMLAILSVHFTSVMTLLKPQRLNELLK